MRDYAKTGSKKGLPAYRTPSSFRDKKILQNKRLVKKPKIKKGRYFSDRA